MDFEALRDDFPGLARSTYLNSCSLGQPPVEAVEAHRQFMEEWMSLGASAWYEVWVERIAAWRKEHAKLIGAKESEIAWTPSVSQGLSSIASGVARLNPDGFGVVCFDQEFPTASAVWGPRPNTRFDFARSNNRISVSLGEYESAIREDSKVLLASRVFYNSGHVQDVAALQKLVGKNGLLGVIEDYHGTGQLDINVHRSKIDVLAGGCLKWLCGGMDACFLYVRQGIIDEIEPQHSGWWANQKMFDFDNREWKFWDDARRFEMGEVNMHSISMSLESTRKLRKIGIKSIQKRNKELRIDLLERLEDASLEALVEDGKTHSNLIMVKRENPKKDVAKLAKAGVIVDDRPGAVRVSPHFYNTLEENEKFVALLR